MALLSIWEQRADGSKVYWGTAAPSAATDGTFEVGDVVINTAPAAGQPPYWICTVRGAAGTWKAAANLV